MRANPVTIAEAVDTLRRRGGRGRLPLVLVGGRVLDVTPRGAQALSPAALPPELHGAERELVLVRLDLEETAPYSRPLLERTDLGRDFYLADESGRALVRVGTGGRAHPDLELHLDAPPVAREVSEPDEEGVARALYVRTVRAGDPVYVLGRPTLERDEDHSGYRDAPPALAFSPTEPLHLYDDPAFQQWSAWSALPWYRKLSVLARNR
jgi:hypothetical protein